MINRPLFTYLYLFLCVAPSCSFVRSSTKPPTSTSSSSNYNHPLETLGNTQLENGKPSETQPNGIHDTASASTTIDHKSNIEIKTDPWNNMSPLNNGEEDYTNHEKVQIARRACIAACIPQATRKA
mmetsp:Transcript_11101/g.13571  ORF Transcript_11101/g.13571 Transcript_11101/m.13571 type:complete len:126 (+) Transcript_11101:46-423(+)